MRDDDSLRAGILFADVIVNPVTIGTVGMLDADANGAFVDAVAEFEADANGASDVDVIGTSDVDAVGVFKALSGPEADAPGPVLSFRAASLPRLEALKISMSSSSSEVSSRQSDGTRIVGMASGRRVILFKVKKLQRSHHKRQPFNDIENEEKVLESFQLLIESFISR